MNEHALHFVIRSGVWGRGVAGAIPLWFWTFWPFVVVGLSAQSRMVMMIIPLPHYGIMVIILTFCHKKIVSESPPPPPPPPECRCQGWRNSQRDC